MAKQPDPFPSLIARIRKIEELQRRMQSASPFFGTGFHPNGTGGMDSDNYVAGVSGYSFKDTGNAEFNDLTIRGGIIANDALTNPVRGDAAHDTGTGFAITTTGTTPLAGESWFTPAGFTACTVHVTGRVFAFNSTASLDYLYARVRVRLPSTGAVAYGNGLPLAVSASGGSGINTSIYAVRVENLDDGEEVRFEIQGWTSNAGWSANPSNVADVAASVIWTR